MCAALDKGGSSRLTASLTVAGALGSVPLPQLVHAAISGHLSCGHQPVCRVAVSRIWTNTLLHRPGEIEQAQTHGSSTALRWNLNHGC